MTADQMIILGAFFVTFLAGSATMVGGVIGLTKYAANERFLSIALSFSAGVMIYISFVEIFPKSVESLMDTHVEKNAMIIAMIAFFVGILIMIIIDKIFPSIGHLETDNVTNPKDEKLLRMGLFSACAIAIHNFPEGLATFLAFIEDPYLGISIAFAIAIHNIPEGIAISVPIYNATKSRKKAFGATTLAGMAEPLGALFGFMLLRNVYSPSMFGILFSMTAGIMIYISFDELLPTAYEYGSHKDVMLGLFCGMILMAFSLVLFL